MGQNENNRRKQERQKYDEKKKLDAKNERRKEMKKKIEVSGEQNLFHSIFYKNKNFVNNIVTLISNKKKKMGHRILKNLKN